MQNNNSGLESVYQSSGGGTIEWSEDQWRQDQHAMGQCLAQTGLIVIPVCSAKVGGGCSAWWHKEAGHVGGKTPLGKYKHLLQHGPDVALSQLRCVRESVNLAVLIPDGIVVVEADSPQADAEIVSICGGSEPATWTREPRPGRGRMFFFANDARISSRAHLGYSGAIDVKGPGSIAVVPWSIHHTGHLYQWAPGRAPWEIAPTPLPVALANLIDKSRTTSKPRRKPAAMPRAGEVPRVVQELSRRVADLLAADERLAQLWRGEGRTSGDLSASGYDFAIACHLVRARLPAQEVINALAVRPGVSKIDGRYLERTVRRAEGDVQECPRLSFVEAVDVLKTVSEDQPIERRVDACGIPVETIRRRYIGDLGITVPSVTYVNSSLGSGKTEAIRSLIEGTNASILVITQHISLVESIAKRLDIVSYNEENVAASRRISTTLDSVHKVPVPDGGFDVVVIEESESTIARLRTIAAQDPERVGSVYAALCRFVQNAQAVVCLDEGLGPLTIRTLRRMSGGDPQYTYDNERLLENSYRSSPRSVLIYSRRSGWQQQLLRSLSEKKKLIVHTTSPQSADTIERLIRVRYPALRVWNVNGNNISASQRSMLRDINRTVIEYDVVIASPVITSGVSIDVEYFDEIWLHATDSSVPTTSLVQMVHRARKVRSPVIHVWVQSTNHGYPEDADAIAQTWGEQNEWTDFALGANWSDEPRRPIRGQPPPRVRQWWDRDLFAIMAEIEAKARKETNNLKAAFISELDSRDIPHAEWLDLGDVEEEKKANSEWRDASFGVRSDRAELTAAAPEMGIAQANKIDDSGNATAEERASAAQAIIRNFYGDAAATTILDDDEGRARTRLRRFVDVRLVKEQEINLLLREDGKSYRFNANALQTRRAITAQFYCDALSTYGLGGPIQAWSYVRLLTQGRRTYLMLGDERRDITEAIAALTDPRTVLGRIGQDKGLRISLGGIGVLRRLIEGVGVATSVSERFDAQAVGRRAPGAIVSRRLSADECKDRGLELSGQPWVEHQIRRGC